MSVDGHNKDVLRLLFPVELAGDHDADLALEGGQLDAAQERAEDLENEMFADTTLESLSDWERVLGIVAAIDEPTEARREACLAKIRAKGGLSRAYFIALAAGLSYEIEIDELLPFMVDWHGIGDSIEPEEIIFCWRVRILNRSLYYFRVSSSSVGDPLLWFRLAEDLEALFTELKPAHTYVSFEYQEA